MSFVHSESEAGYRKTEAGRFEADFFLEMAYARQRSYDRRERHRLRRVPDFIRSAVRIWATGNAGELPKQFFQRRLGFEFRRTGGTFRTTSVQSFAL